MKQDKELLELKHQIKVVGDLVGHEGWEIVAKNLTESVEAIQNLSDIKLKDFDKETLYIEMRARELAVSIINSWFTTVMGVAEVAQQSLQEQKESYIITKEN